MRIIEIINQPGLILTPSINITQINRVILSPITLVINVILRSARVVEFRVEDLSLLEALVTVGTEVALGLVVFVVAGREETALVQELVVVF